MADNTDEQPLHTYRGNCHCGAFVYELDQPEIKSAYQCNCSVCTRKGYLWVFTGVHDDLRWAKGSIEGLTSYTFNKGELVHKFCPTCGTALFGYAPTYPPGKRLAVNTHAIQGIDTGTLEKTPFDGAKREPAYVPTPHKGPEPKAKGENEKLYTGSCHCGAVTVAVTTEPLDETYKGRILECNCSICERNAYVWIYPKAENVVLAGDPEQIGRYSFGKRLNAKTFCKTCGVQMTNARNDFSEEEVAALSEPNRKRWEFFATGHPVNARVLDGVDLSKMNIPREDGPKSPPHYVNP